MNNTLKIGIAGLGTVGVGVIKILTENKHLISTRAGRSIEVVAVSARDKNKDRGINLSGIEWVDNTADLSKLKNCDVVVELIGGSDGVAHDLVSSALKSKKHVVTANKALIATHGYDLAKIAEDANVALCYEAAVAGGIPIIKSIREGLCANNFTSVYGILNGTCNYILTQMRETGRDFEGVLKDAQDLGYAEADPSFDVGGVDAAHKLCILTALAFGVKPDFSALEIQGIDHLNSTDIQFAKDFGYRIKLLGVARVINEKVMQVVEPCLVPIHSALGGVEDVYNAVYTECDFVQKSLLTGRGAGEGPTASSVVADIIDIARGNILPTFGIPYHELKDAQWVDIGTTQNRYYLRLNVIDKPGVIADISAILRDHNISIEGMIQHGRDPGQPVPIVITTHDTAHKDMLSAVEKIENLQSSTEKPCLIAIEEL